MAWNTILFDLDGTLTDPAEGITKAVEAALNHYGITVADRAALHKFIGPPLDESFPEFYGFDAARTAEATEVFRAYFDRQGWRENIPYPGVEDMLRDLRAAGKQLLVATSKPEVFALRIIEHFGLARYFDHICGAPMDNQEGAKKAAVIRDALRRAGDSAPPSWWGTAATTSTAPTRRAWRPSASSGGMGTSRSWRRLTQFISSRALTG